MSDYVGGGIKRSAEPMVFAFSAGDGTLKKRVKNGR